MAEQHRYPGPAMTAYPLIGRTARYAIVGAICAATSNAVMILGDLAGVHYIPLSVLSFSVVTPVGYVLHCSFTFKETPSLLDFLRFASGVATGLPLCLLVMAVLCSGLGMSVALAAPITTVTLVIWNYASAHWAIRSYSRRG